LDKIKRHPEKKQKKNGKCLRKMIVLISLQKEIDKETIEAEKKSSVSFLYFRGRQMERDVL